MKRLNKAIVLSLSFCLAGSFTNVFAADTTSGAGGGSTKPAADEAKVSGDWEATERKAEEAFVAGNLTEAGKLWKQAIEVAEKSKQELNVATSLNTMNHLYMRTGEFEKAHEDLQKALAIRERLLKKGDLQIAETMGNLALISQKLHRHHEAEEWYKKALDVKKLTLKEDDPRMAVTMHNLARLYGEERRYKESLDLLKKVLVIDEKQYGKNHIEIVRDLTSIGVTCFKCKENKEAIDYFEQALAVAKEANIKERAELVPIHHYLGVVYADQKDPAKAKEHYEHANTIGEEVHGKDHTSNTIVNLNLAHNAEELGDNEKAETLYKQILAVEENRKPRQEYYLTECLTELGQFYHRHGKKEEALATFEKAMKSYDVLPSHTKRKLYELPLSMTALLKELGKTDEADQLGQKYLHVHTPHGEKHFRL